MCSLHGTAKNQAAIRYLFKIGSALAFLTIGSIPVALADDLTGQVSVIDSDTLEIHGTRICLWESMLQAPWVGSTLEADWRSNGSPIYRRG
jgi:hypothetical protein